MRVSQSLLALFFLGVAACQPKDVKINRFNNAPRTGASGFSEMSTTTATHEDMFQYSLTRLQQMLSLVKVTTKDPSSSCVQSVVLQDSGKNQINSLSYQNCVLDQAPQSEDLSIAIDRGIHEINFIKKDEKQSLSFDNLQAMTLITRVPMDIHIQPTAKSLRRGVSDISEDIFFQLVADSARANFFQFQFKVQGKFFEQVNTAQWDSRTNGEENIFLRGWIAYDPAQKVISKVYLQEMTIKDIRPKDLTMKSIGSGGSKKKGAAATQDEAEQKKQSTQIMSVYLKYGTPEDAKNPALAFSINEQDCWSLYGEGRLQKTKNGFESFTDDKGSKEKKSTDKPAAISKGILFNVDNEKLTLGESIAKWPGCNKTDKPLLPVNVGYGAIFIR